MSRPVILCANCGQKATHKARGWCARCYRRWIYCGKPSGGPPPRKLIACGSVKGWDKHMRDRTAPCGLCRAAHNTAVREHYQERGKRLQAGRTRCYTAAPSEWDEDQRHAAGLAAAAAADASDCRLLLEALGLIASGAPRRTWTGGRAGAVVS